jgi:hypothetical protein
MAVWGLIIAQTRRKCNAGLARREEANNRSRKWKHNCGQTDKEWIKKSNQSWTEPLAPKAQPLSV